MPTSPLSQLYTLIQTNRARSLSSLPETDKGDVRLVLTVEGGEQKPMLAVCDKKLRPLTFNADEYSGDLGTLLRAVERLLGEYTIGWDAEPQQKVCLAEHPELMFLLQRCADAFVDGKGEALTFHDEQVWVRLSLRKDVEAYTTAIVVQGREDTDVAVLAALSDGFVLCADRVIYPVAPLGANFPLLLSFAGQRVPEVDMENFLSVFFSYVNNVRMARDEFRLTDRGETIQAVPTLCFEKVDADKSLYLKVMNSIPDINDPLTESLQLTVRAFLGPDATVSLKHIQRRPLDESIKILGKIIAQAAPDRQSRKDIYQDGDFFIVPETCAGPFLFNALPQLLANFALLGSEKLREYRVSPVAPKLRVKLASGIDFLEGDAKIEFGDEQMSLQDVLAAWRKQHYVQLSDGNRAIIADSYMKRLERIFDVSKKRKDGTVKVSFFDLPEIEDLLQERVEGAAFAHHREVFAGFNDLKRRRLAKPNVQAALRDYQREGVKWIKYLYDNSLGGCLADDMGLGKTLQTIAVLADIYPGAELPTLIVMPRSLIFNWQGELQRFAPQLSVYTYYAQERDIDKATKAQVVLTTYAVVRNDIERLKDREWQYVILDESQNIKNVAAQATQAVHLLRTAHRLALSGTPVENNLTELYSLFRFLNPAMFGTLETFNARYTYPIQKDGDKNVLTALRRKIYPFLLRRLKKDVLAELPDRTDQQLRVEMSEPQRRLYEERRRYYKGVVERNVAEEGVQKSQFVIFQALNELRQIASIPEAYSDSKIASPKIEQLLASLEEAVENGHKCVVFFNFLLGIELVAERLNKLGIEYAEMTGATTNRRRVVERFQRDPECAVMLMTLKTGGVGLNLTAADTVFIFEPWWNKAAEEQAINRLHRIGQTQKVLAYSLVAEETIEEKILLLQQQKAELFDGLIGSDTTSQKVLTEADIDFIFG